MCSMCAHSMCALSEFTAQPGGKIPSRDTSLRQKERSYFYIVTLIFLCKTKKFSHHLCFKNRQWWRDLLIVVDSPVTCLIESYGFCFAVLCFCTLLIWRNNYIFLFHFIIIIYIFCRFPLTFKFEIVFYDNSLTLANVNSLCLRKLILWLNPDKNNVSNLT